MFGLLTTFRAHSGNVLTGFDQLGDDIVCTVTWKHPFDDEVCEEVGRIELNINHSMRTGNYLLSTKSCPKP